MKRTSGKLRSPPDAMTDPACRDGGGLDAASALALRLVDEAAIEQEIGRRTRQSFGGEREECAALKLGIAREALRESLDSGRLSAAFMQRVCLAYGVDGHWLLTGQGEPAIADRTTKCPGGTPPTEVLEGVLDMLSGRYPSDEFAELRPRLTSAIPLDRRLRRSGISSIIRWLVRRNKKLAVVHNSCACPPRPKQNRRWTVD